MRPFSPPDDAPGQEEPPSLGASYFDELYHRAANSDPWNFASSAYESAKYTATLERLPRPRYHAVLEVGCSIGVFTRRLAERVDHLLGIDIAAAALDQARQRCGDQPHCRFALADPTRSVPAGPYDLIVLAEVAYYWSRADLASVLRSLIGELEPGGQIILVHWRESVPDYPQTGDEVHRQARDLAAEAGLTPIGEWVESKYRIDLWEVPAQPNEPKEPTPVRRRIDRS